MIAWSRSGASQTPPRSAAADPAAVSCSVGVPPRARAAGAARGHHGPVAGGSTQWRGRTVISKVVALLDAFSPAAPELSLGELARITGLPVSTTYRLVSELVEWGGLERATSGTGYRIGVRMWELGALAPRSSTLREVAVPFMQDLYE